MRFAPIWGFFLADRRFTVESALIMRFTRSQVLGETGIIREIASVFPGLWGFLKSVFQLTRSIVIQEQGIEEA
jgi:hypothetical protein